MNAQEARRILNQSNKYFETVLESVYTEVKSQSDKGLNWAHVNIKGNDTAEFFDRVKSELIIKGYNVDSMNTSHDFTIKW